MSISTLEPRLIEGLDDSALAVFDDLFPQEAAEHGANACKLTYSTCLDGGLTLHP